MTVPTPEKRTVERLRELIAEATPRPWKMLDPGYIVARGRSIVGTDSDGDARIAENADADLIVAAVNSLPALLAVYDAAREAVHSYENPTASVMPRIDIRMAALAAAVQRVEEGKG